MPSQHFAMGLSLAFVLLFNKAFFFAAWNTQSADSFGAIVFFVSLIPLLWMLTFFFISLVCIPGIIKPISVFLLIGGSFASHFMDTYGVVIDKEMLRNVWETDTQEAAGLLNLHLIGYLIVLGVLPSLLVIRTNIIWSSVKREFVVRTVSVILSLVVSFLLILSLSNYYSSFFRNHKEVRFLANPLGFVNAGISLLRENSSRPLVIDPISQDARLGTGTIHQTKPVLIVFVVGETARAANFGLSGYQRDTTPLLAKQDIIYFNNFSSCGTSTAVSLPCMFSSLSRDDYSDNKAKSRHGLLDFISASGVDVLWRDNNSGCKGTCDRVLYESPESLSAESQCENGNCYDEVLLNNLPKKITAGNQFIVLHQKGSHGPAYNQRYPNSMQFYTPVCSSNQLQKCSQAEVINAYDNTIRYTDYFLNSVVEWLKTQQSTHNTAMIYVSDHGESLGENNLYLHGMPYAIAPEFQKHVPFIFWASSSFYRDRGLSKECLNKLKAHEFSHDNIFHSFLGLLDIDTKHYQPGLDIFSSCFGRY
ncbi:MAG: phosphoethanolamine transferase [Cellvibrio sp. 79]|nr:MAG: phosphoethanolamine transferase [Cellvibrio sp. 79]